jgi:hypothetical protein
MLGLTIKLSVRAEFRITVRVREFRELKCRIIELGSHLLRYRERRWGESGGGRRITTAYQDQR